MIFTEENIGQSGLGNAACTSIGDKKKCYRRGGSQFKEKEAHSQGDDNF